jgi:hypothetical protein
LYAIENISIQTKLGPNIRHDIIAPEHDITVSPSLSNVIQYVLNSTENMPLLIDTQRWHVICMTTSPSKNHWYSQTQRGN